MPKTRQHLKHLSFVLLFIAGVNLIGNYMFKRFDMTKDQRYTLSSSITTNIKAIRQPLIIDMFLEGNLPSEFRVLQTETMQLIDEFQNLNPRIKVNYIDPLKDEKTRDRNIKALSQSGLEPYVNSEKISGKITQELIFPWCFGSYNGKTIKIPLLKKNLTDGLKQQVTNSIQQLEYNFADAFKQLTTEKSKRIAMLKGNGQLSDIYVYDFLNTLKAYYYIAPFTLDSVAKNPVKTLETLKTFDLLISAKPTEAFTEDEKLVLDQYTMSGGKSIWLTEAMAVDKDSLYNASGATVSTGRDLNLNDFFFQYGVRINQNLVKDLYSAPIALAIGEGSNTQFQPVQWQYSPLGTTQSKHPISNNLDLVKFDFTSQIDTLKNNINKTILLHSSERSKLEGALQTISLSSVTQQPNEASFNQGKQTLAVLLEGKFTSVYKNRILPLKLNNYLQQGQPTKIIVIADGDIIKNEISRNKPLPLGFERITGRTFANKEFLLNTVNYLLDDDGLINIRAKSVETAFLDVDKIKSKKVQWQLVNMFLPLVILAVFGFGFNILRRRKNSK